MQIKTVSLFLYEGLGFPIELEGVEMILFNNEWLPKIDVHKVADEAIKRLAIQGSRLTGNQVKFIRTYFSMSLREFSEVVVHESHTAVSKWENKADDVTHMNENTEQVLRLYIIEQTQAQTKTQQSNFYQSFQESKIFFKSKDKKAKPIHINMHA